MIDNVYKNSFKEVYEILQNTEDELVKKIPFKFIKFLESNMNKEYQTKIDNTLELDKQLILPETENILSLIYRNYWATEAEKANFNNKDKNEYIGQEFKENNIYEIFEQRKNRNSVNIDNNLMILKKESFISKIFNRILNFFHKK